MHGDPDNLESLHNKREQESYQATHEYIQMLLETVDKDQELLRFWSMEERLATYLAEQTGIKLRFASTEDTREKSIVMSGQNIAWRINRIQRKERSREKLA